MKIYLLRHHGTAQAEIPELHNALELRTHAQQCVVLVEDEPGIREVVAEVLADLGFEVLVAEDGPFGLHLLESTRHLDLLISDIGLPGMNGRTLADRARAIHPHLPVLFMTGYAEHATLGAGFLAPGMDTITKPFAISLLTSRVKSILRTE